MSWGKSCQLIMIRPAVRNLEACSPHLFMSRETDSSRSRVPTVALK